MSARVPLGAVLFFALLAAALAVSVLVVRARTPDLVLEVLEPDRGFTFAPGGGEGRDAAEFRFFVRREDSEATVTVVDAHEGPVRTLDEGIELEAGREVSYSWDGMTDAGAPAPPGRYRLGVELPESDREMVWPIRITVEAEGERAEGGAQGGGE